MQQVRFKSSEYFANERKRSESQDAMLTKDEAIAVGMTTALRTGGRREPRTYSRASECISYHLDDNGNKVGAFIFRESPRNKRARAIKNIPTNRKLTCADLRPIFAD